MKEGIDMVFNERARRTGRFAVTGMLSLGAYYVSYIGLTEAGLHYQLSSVCGFIAYCIVNFLFNKYWTFRSDGPVLFEVGQHFLLHLFNQGVIMVGLYVLVERYAFDYLSAQIFLTVLIAIEVFVVSHLIFRKR